jgi:hypothetical protein
MGPAAQQTLFFKAIDMITSHRTCGLLWTASLLISGTFFQVAPASAADTSQRYADQRIVIDHARPIRGRQASPKSRRPSMIAQAAAGQIVETPAEAPLDGTLVNSGVVPANCGSCGPVCDCGHAGIHPQENAGGVEVGCGIGAALHRLGPTLHMQGQDRACGIEGATVVADVGCGFEPTGNCSCAACTGHANNRIPFSLPLLRVNWQSFDFFFGNQGFTGPLNFVNTDAGDPNVRGGTGSFGFHQGFNVGVPATGWSHTNLAWQFGVRAAQSNVKGAGFTDETRNQVFLTTGVFRRVDCGLQYGMVLDYLSDDWYYQGSTAQLRGEFSWRHGAAETWGFQYMAGVRDDTSVTAVTDSSGSLISSVIAFEPTDQYRFFYRRLLNHSGHWSAFAGWTDQDDGLLGGDLSLPVRRCMVLRASSTYLIPREGSSSGGDEQEGWNISIGLVYRPGGPSGCDRYTRPLFDVADNGTFMVDRL